MKTTCRALSYVIICCLIVITLFCFAGNNETGKSKGNQLEEEYELSETEIESAGYGDSTDYAIEPTVYSSGIIGHRIATKKQSSYNKQAQALWSRLGFDTSV